VKGVVVCRFETGSKEDGKLRAGFLQGRLGNWDFFKKGPSSTHLSSEHGKKGLFLGGGLKLSCRAGKVLGILVVVEKQNPKFFRFLRGFWPGPMGSDTTLWHGSRCSYFFRVSFNCAFVFNFSRLRLHSRNLAANAASGFWLSEIKG